MKNAQLNLRQLVICLLALVSLLSCTKNDETKKVSVESIKISESEISLNINDTHQIIAEVIPNNATEKTLMYRSEKEDIASVDANGIITAISEGTTAIKIQAEGNITSILQVTVNKAPLVIPAKLLGDWKGVKLELTNGSDIYNEQEIKESILDKNMSNQEKDAWINERINNYTYKITTDNIIIWTIHLPNGITRDVEGILTEKENDEYEYLATFDLEKAKITGIDSMKEQDVLYNDKEQVVIKAEFGNGFDIIIYYQKK